MNILTTQTKPHQHRFLVMMSRRSGQSAKMARIAKEQATIREIRIVLAAKTPAKTSPVFTEYARWPHWIDQ